MRDRYYWYDQIVYNFGSFYCVEDRDCVGLYCIEVEFDVNGGKLREKFKNIIVMDKVL